jgi:hypothetical protein
VLKIQKNGRDLHPGLEALRDGVIWRLRRAGIANPQEIFEQIKKTIELEMSFSSCDILIRMNSEVRKVETRHTGVFVPVCSAEAEALRQLLLRPVQCSPSRDSKEPLVPTGR